jgi:hypothetical protein
MFYDRRLLLPWVADHTNVHSGMWLLYFASQLFLLPVPLALYTLKGTLVRGDRESQPRAQWRALPRLPWQW